MRSLKSFLPLMSGLIGGTTPGALYTRQRALVDLGLLDYRGGRGPGSGSPLTGENIAALLIAMMTADTLETTDQRVAAMCRAKPRDGTCPFTGNRTLQAALGTVLDSAELCSSFASLTILRGRGADLGYGRPNKAAGSAFDVWGRYRSEPSQIALSARVEATLIRQLFAASQAERTS